VCSSSPETRPAWPRYANSPGDGLASKRNGDLLRVAEQEFDVFLTVDQKLQDQQNLSAFNIAVIVSVAPNNTLAELRPLMPKVLESLPTPNLGKRWSFASTLKAFDLRIERCRTICAHFRAATLTRQRTSGTVA
jgi:hypothetical protein